MSAPSASGDRPLSAAEVGLQKLDCTNCPPESSAVCVNNWEFLENPDHVIALNQGRTLFAFESCVGSGLTETLKSLIESKINITGFANEEKENASIPIDVRNPDQASKYTFLVTKVAYMLPGISLSDITPELFGFPDYHEACQPGNPVIWRDCPDPTTFRITKTIIPFVFKITIQLKAALASPAAKAKVEENEKRPIDKLLVLERTKRNLAVQDMTYKCKSFMAYNAVKGGVFVSHTTIVLNTMIPTYGTWILNNMSSFGSKESFQTAEFTRKNLPGVLVTLANKKESGQETKQVAAATAHNKAKKKSLLGRFRDA